MSKLKFRIKISSRFREIGQKIRGYVLAIPYKYVMLSQTNCRDGQLAFIGPHT